MGREYRILLGFLGLLAGVFVGLLSKKLLVPRPPVGAGPDVDVRTVYDEPTEIVEPPRLTLQASAFAAAPPLVAAAPTGSADPPRAGGSPVRSARGDLAEQDIEGSRPASMFVRSAVEHELEPLPTAAPTGRELDDDGDPAMPAAAAPRRFEPVEDALPLGASRPDMPPPPAPRDPFAADRAGVAPRPEVPAPLSRPDAGRPVAAGGVAVASYATAPGVHVAQSGDSWWSVAEAAYGDGRLYRAVFAWNRAVDPRVSLAVGTRLELPPLEKLRAAWPALVPGP